MTRLMDKPPGNPLSPLRVTEAQTRYSLIDPELARIRWNLSDRTQVKLEILVNGYDSDESYVAGFFSHENLEKPLFSERVMRIETLPLCETVLRMAFDTFILKDNYNTRQSRFLRVA